MQIESPAFANGGAIPSVYTCDGEGINPPLSFRDVPKEAKSLALIVDDPDIPESAKKSYSVEVWDHWIIWNISPETVEINQDSVPVGAVIGKNTSGNNLYGPPCPPDREHRYFFKLYALDTTLELNPNTKGLELIKAMQGHILIEAELMGRYQRK